MKERFEGPCKERNPTKLLTAPPGDDVTMPWSDSLVNTYSFKGEINNVQRATW
jgi:hypothetical protein